MAQLKKKAEGWVVLDATGKHVFETEAEAQKYMGEPAAAPVAAPVAAPGPEEKPEEEAEEE